MLRTKKKNRRDNTTTIATWNLNGRLKEPTRQEELFADMRGKRVDIAALQETGSGSSRIIVIGSIGISSRENIKSFDICSTNMIIPTTVIAIRIKCTTTTTTTTIGITTTTCLKQWR